MSKNKYTAVLPCKGAPGNTVDRITAACARSLKTAGIPFVILDRRFPSPWLATRYRRGVRHYHKSRTLREELDCMSRQDSFALFPIGEQEARLSFEIAEKNRKDTTSSARELTAYEKLGDKGSCKERAHAAGLTNPRSWSLQHPPAVPCFLKSGKEIDQDGQKTPRPRFIEDPQSTPLPKDCDNFFLQERIQGVSIYVCGFFYQDELLFSFVQKNLRQASGGGSILKAKPEHVSPPKSVFTGLEKLLREAGWIGPFMAEFIKTKKDWYLIEINPRLWGPVQLAEDNGYPFSVATYYLLIGDSEETIKTKHSYSVTGKQQVGFIHWAGHLEKVEAIAPPTKTKQPFMDVFLRADTAAFFILAAISATARRARSFWGHHGP